MAYQGGSGQVLALAGTERVGIDNGGGGNAETNTASIAMLANLNNFIFQTNTATAATTLTAANVAGAVDEVDLNMTGTLAGAANATLPLATAAIAVMPIQSVGFTYKLRVINSGAGAFAWTVVTAAGWTLTGTMSVAQNTWRDFIVTVTSTTTLTLQNVGTGTYS